jgi:methionyl aminopeptidase
MALIKTNDEVARMRVAGKILARTLRELKEKVAPGVTGAELDSLARTLIREAGGEPAFLNYRPDGAERGFPATLCVSINAVVVHGVPTRVPFAPGDLVKLDLGVRYRGYYADAALTVAVPPVDAMRRKLIVSAEEALREGIFVAKPGNTLGDIGAAIKARIEHHGFSVIQGLTGHGIGSILHEDPVVWNEGTAGKGMILKAGMVLAIEPMVSAGSPRVIQELDESYATTDGSLSSHAEHTIYIGAEGPEILTVI